METQEAYWRELGLWPRWALRSESAATLITPPPLAPPVIMTSASHDASLADRVHACTRCPLHTQRRQAVVGLIYPGSPWLFIGEAPGAEEDAQGLPFVGAAGQLLDRMLAALNLTRGPQVSIANIIKCRPPHNRTPTDTECQSCLPYLQEQMAQIQPRVLVLLGKVAAHALLGLSENMSTLRGKVHSVQRIPTIVTWHPAYLLRSPQEKAGAWADLCHARRLLEDA